MLLTPGIWSGLTTFSTSNQTLPAAYGGQSFQGGFSGGFNMPGGNDQNGLQVNQALLDYLQQIALFSDADAYDTKTDRVALMTLHTAKGLEFEKEYSLHLLT